MLLISDLNFLTDCVKFLVLRDLYLLLFFNLFFVLGQHLHNMEVPLLGIKLELQLLAYTTATITQDLSCTSDLHHSSQQCQIISLLNKARDQIHIFIGTS